MKIALLGITRGDGQTKNLLPFVSFQEMTAKQAWDLCHSHMAEFVDVPYPQFRARLYDHRKQMKQGLARAAKDKAALDHDRRLHPRKLTNGRGADVVLEVVGATATIQTAVESARKGGSITLVGNLAPTVEMPLQAIVTRELSVYGTCASNGEYPACIDLLASGAIRVEDMITATAALDEGADWFARLYAGEPGAMKVILDPTR